MRIKLNSVIVQDQESALRFYIEKEYQRLKALGVVFTSKPADAGSAVVAVFEDTCGNLIQIYEES